MNTNAIFHERYGRLGNQLFQVGLLFAIAQRRGHAFYLPREGQSVWGCFDLDIPAGGPACIHRFDEVNGSCNYDPGVFEQADGTSYHGFFQSYRYLDDCKEALVRFLHFKLPYRALSEAMLFAYRRRHRRPLVSLHVRRDDYLTPGNEERFGNLAADGYYERVVEAVGSDVTYLVFSDDIGWCRRSLTLERAEFVDVDHCTSLCLMTGCDVNVVANSSFSWWGAYLNPGAQEVYAPSRWFTSAMAPPNDVQMDIVPPDWRTIPVFGDADARSRPGLTRGPGIQGSRGSPARGS
jgi:hypothetical protein